VVSYTRVERGEDKSGLKKAERWIVLLLRLRENTLVLMMKRGRLRADIPSMYYHLITYISAPPKVRG